jgi:hypothetical protein
MNHPATDSQAKNAAARDLATNAPVHGLTAGLCTWLYATHEQLARELHRSQSTAAEHEAMIAVDTLPEATRRYLWQSMQRHHPDLAQLVRDPVIAALRERFSASLHLHVPDVLQVIVNAARASRRTAAANASSGVSRETQGAGPATQGVARDRERSTRTHRAAP